MRFSTCKRSVSRRLFCLLGGIVLMISGGPAWSAFDETDLQRRSSWRVPSADEVLVRLEEWLEEADLPAETHENVLRVWEQSAEGPLAESMLDRLAAALAQLDEQTREVVTVSRSPSRPATPPSFAWLHDEEHPSFVRHHLRLVLGRWLAQQAFYDEALQELHGLTVDDVVDPAALLFYQGVVHHRLLNKDDCLAALDKLVENEPAVPRRYLTVARLMVADLKPLRVDSLDEVARLMEDIQRRLQLGRAGTRVRQEEDDVIAKLDKMIEEIEQQQQQQQQQQQSGSGQGRNQSSNPAEDSAPLGGKGPGDVDQKDIGKRSGWGNLPPKDREEALQQISKDLPSHFREVIEEYFRKLARDEG